MGNALPSNRIAAASEMDPISMEDLIAMYAERKEGHGKNISILRSVSGITSMISSSTLIWMITRSHKGLSTTQHRILLGLSVCDLISSLGCSTFNTMAPSEVKYRAWNARGNEASCDAQGFLLAFGITGGLWYNATLCLYYVAVVKYGKSEDYIRTRIEPFLHGIPIVVALAYSIAFLVEHHFNDAHGICNLPVHYPPHCWGYDVGVVRDGFDIPCGRGIEGADATLISQMVGLFIPGVIIIASLVAIYRAIKKQENKLKKYGVNAINLNLNSSSMWKRMKTSLTRRSSASSNNAYPAIRSNNTQSQSRVIMHRAFQYSAAWFLSYGLYTLVVITNFQIVFDYLSNIFAPLQGFFNLCIYMYPKVKSARKPKRGQDKMTSWCQAISIAFWSRGKDTRKRENRPSRPQTSNLRNGRINRPSRAANMKKNTNDNAPQMIKTPHFFRSNKKTTKDDKKTHHRREPQEEEEKCEIQPVIPNLHSKLSQLTYAPNLTHPSPVAAKTTAAHPVIDSTVQDDGEGVAASETSDHEGAAASEASDSVEGGGKDESSAGLDDDLIKKDESSIIGNKDDGNDDSKDDLSAGCNDAAILHLPFSKNETETKA